MLRLKLLLFFVLGATMLGVGCGPEEAENDNDETQDPPLEVDLDITAVVPNSGSEGGGLEVRVEGAGFLEGVADTPGSASFQTVLRFGGSNASGVEVISDSVIRVVTPPHEPGLVDVTIDNPHGQAVCVECFEYEEDDEKEPDEPGVEVKITRLSPIRGPVEGGTRVRIEGNGFVLGFGAIGGNVEDDTTVSFGENTAIDVNVVDDELMEVVAPPNPSGDATVRIENPNGDAECEDCFHYYIPVRAKSVDPSFSPMQGGVEVTVTGTGLSSETLVRVGGRPGVQPLLLDEETISFFTPPADVPGAADIEILNANGTDTLRRRLIYYEEPRLLAVEPPVGVCGGGTEVRLRGEGLVGADSVSFGEVLVNDVRESGSDLLVTAPPGTAGIAVDVEILHEHGDTMLAGAYSYVDADSRDVSLVAVSPRRGTTEGGKEVLLAGTGLDHPSPIVRFGGSAVEAVSVIDGNRIAALVPETEKTGTVDVQVRNDRGGALLADGFVYDSPLRVDELEPDSGPAEGGTEVTITGEGFGEGQVTVRVGAMPASDVIVNEEGTVISAVTPPGGGGPANVIVERSDTETWRRSVLTGGFTYIEPLLLVRVDPHRGSQAGGTRVLLSGAGLYDVSEVYFGDEQAEVLDKRQGMITVAAPPAKVGEVDVSVSRGAEENLLRDAFEYYDPTNSIGGASGGAMAGTLNVTVLDNRAGMPLPEAHVMLGSESDTIFQGRTDARGQITFSDPSLVKPVQVTVWRPGFEAVSVVGIDTRNLTILLTPTGMDYDPDPVEPSPPPTPSPPLAFINARPDVGRVCGFKLPPDRQLGPNQREEARVWTTASSISSLPPSGWRGSFRVIDEDCGTFGMASRTGSIALYAKYGIVTEETDPVSGQKIESFEPLLMGMTRGIEVPPIDPPRCTPNQACPTGFNCDGEEDMDPTRPGEFRWCLCESDDACDEGEICNVLGACQPPIEANIVLNMHMDVDVPISLLEAPTPPDGRERVDATYAYLELGGDGVVFLAEVMHADQDEFVIEGMPRLPGDNFVFMNMSTSAGGYPLSIYYRRQVGDIGSDLTIGPMQPMTRLISPASGVLNGGRVQWSYEGGMVPDIVNVRISERGFMPAPVWRIILAGSESSVKVPQPVMELMQQASSLEISLVTALAPRFDFDYFSYRNLNLRSWTSYTQDIQSFAVPQ